MTAKHVILWTDGERTHLATRNAYRRGEASWRHDEALSVPEELVTAIGLWQWQTPVNGPFPVFATEKITEILAWLVEHGYTAVVLAAPPSATRLGSVSVTSQHGARHATD